MDWHCDSGNRREARRLYMRAAAAGADVPLPEHCAADFLAAGNVAIAESLLTDWPGGGTPKRPPEIMAQVSALQRLGFNETALLLLAKGAEAHPQVPAIATRRALLAMQTGDGALAESELARTLELDPGQPAWMHAALHALRHGEAESAGLRLSLPPDVVAPDILSAILRGGYEAVERQAVLADLRPGDRVLELGTGIGAMAIWMQQRHPGLPITTVEANPALAPVIARNFELNGCTATALSGVASLEEGEADFHQAENFAASSVLPVDGTKATLSLPRIDVNRLMKDLRPTLLVMDIEGAEAELLPGMRLDGLRRIVVELHPALVPPAGIGAIFARLAAEGFDPDLAAAEGDVVVFVKSRQT